MKLRTWKRGDKYVWGTGLPYQMFGEVVKVAKDGTWVDMRLQTYMFKWGHRYYTHVAVDALMLDPKYMKNWTPEEVEASRPVQRPTVLADPTVRHPEGY